MIDWIMTLLAFGTLWFWLLVVFINLAIIASIHSKSYGFLTTTIIGSILLFIFVSKVPIQWSVIGLLKWGVIGFAIYFLVGGIYGTFRWWWLVRTQRDHYDDLLAEFLDKEGIEEFDPLTHDGAKWGQYIIIHHKRYSPALEYQSNRERNGFGDETVISCVPKVKNHKSDALDWIAFWPWSLVEWILWDFITEIANRIYRTVTEWWQEIANRIFGDTAGHFGKKAN